MERSYKKAAIGWSFIIKLILALIGLAILVYIIYKVGARTGLGIEKLKEIF